MPPKKRPAGAPTLPAWFGRACLLAGAAAAIAGLVLLSIFVWKVNTFAKEAPAMMGGAIMDYVEAEAPEILDAYVEEKLMPGLQEEILGWMFGPAAPESAATTATDEVTTHRSRHGRTSRHAGRTVSQCPVRDPTMCAKFRETCSALDTCRTLRDRVSCIEFVRQLNGACAINSCDEYYDRSLCDSVTTACRMRMRCMFNQSSCMSMESDLVALCALV
jgi:hypothetical protein